MNIITFNKELERVKHDFAKICKYLYGVTELDISRIEFERGNGYLILNMENVVYDDIKINKDIVDLWTNRIGEPCLTVKEGNNYNKCLFSVSFKNELERVSFLNFNKKNVYIKMISKKYNIKKNGYIIAFNL